MDGREGGTTGEDVSHLSVADPSLEIRSRECDHKGAYDVCYCPNHHHYSNVSLYRAGTQPRLALLSHSDASKFGRHEVCTLSGKLT